MFIRLLNIDFKYFKILDVDVTLHKAKSQTTSALNCKVIRGQDRKSRGPLGKGPFGLFLVLKMLKRKGKNYIMSRPCDVFFNEIFGTV